MTHYVRVLVHPSVPLVPILLFGIMEYKMVPLLFLLLDKHDIKLLQRIRMVVKIQTPLSYLLMLYQSLVEVKTKLFVWVRPLHLLLVEPIVLFGIMV